jgi:hypothetical protein
MDVDAQQHLGQLYLNGTAGTIDVPMISFVVDPILPPAFLIPNFSDKQICTHPSAS